MNHLRLDTYLGAYGTATVRFRIDGVDLRELVRQSELGMGATTQIAGTYDGPDALVVAAPSRHLLGEPAEGWLSSAEVPGTILLMGCTCGTEGCWPLHVRIEVGEQVIRWSGFRNPFREEWGYEGLGPFEFEAQQYSGELRALRELIDGPA
jgi:hypothetical protein